jgi:hypothetical protein
MSKEKDKTFNFEETKVNNSNTVKIIIDEQDSSEGHDDVVVGVNGKAYKIKRGVEVELPLEVVEVLKNAIQGKLVKGVDNEYEVRDMYRFAFREV